MCANPATSSAPLVAVASAHDAGNKRTYWTAFEAPGIPEDVLARINDPTKHKRLRKQLLNIGGVDARSEEGQARIQKMYDACLAVESRGNAGVRRK